MQSNLFLGVGELQSGFKGEDALLAQIALGFRIMQLSIMRKEGKGRMKKGREERGRERGEDGEEKRRGGKRRGGEGERKQGRRGRQILIAFFPARKFNGKADRKLFPFHFFSSYGFSVSLFS